MVAILSLRAAEVGAKDGPNAPTPTRATAVDDGGGWISGATGRMPSRRAGFTLRCLHPYEVTMTVPTMFAW